MLPKPSPDRRTHRADIALGSALAFQSATDYSWVMIEQAFAQLVEYFPQLGWVGLGAVLLVGIVVALAGYRIRLFFFFIVGFYVAAVTIGPLFAALIEAPQTALVFGVIAGFLGGMVAVRMYFVALFLVGLLAGASLLVTLTGVVLPDTQAALLIAAAVGGIIGGIAAITLDRVAVIIASAWVGALHAAAAASTALYLGVGLQQDSWYAVFLGMLVVITAVGVLYQFKVFPARAYRYDRRRAGR